MTWITLAYVEGGASEKYTTIERRSRDGTLLPMAKLPEGGVVARSDGSNEPAGFKFEVLETFKEAPTIFRRGSQ